MTPDRNTLPAPIHLRRIATHAEYDACMAMQYQVWGDDFTELVPAAILQVAQRIGGVTAGAFDDSGALLGFVFGMTGVRDGRLVHWSDLLAVRPDARNMGIGRRLKLYQRELLRPLGVETIYWTFDPLVAKNAHLNLVRLCARPVEYVVDMYGYGLNSQQQGTGSTDRFIVAWDLTSEPAAAAGAGGEHAAGSAGAAGEAAVAAAPVVNVSRDGSGRTPVPVPAARVDAPLVRVQVPADIHRLAMDDAGAERAWRASTRDAFTWYLGRGYRVAAFVRGEDDGRYDYVLAAGDAGAAHPVPVRDGAG